MVKAIPFLPNTTLQCCESCVLTVNSMNNKDFAISSQSVLKRTNFSVLFVNQKTAENSKAYLETSCLNLHLSTSDGFVRLKFMINEMIL